MSKFKSLFQKAWTAVTNPGQDQRVSQLLNLISLEFQTHKQNFDLNRVTQQIECTQTDVCVATKQYYEKLLARYWENGVPPKDKQKLLALVAAKLMLKPETVQEVNTSAATVCFGAHLGQFLEDGIVSDGELNKLEEISQFINLSASQFVLRHLNSFGLDFLRSLFAKAIESGRLEPTTWENLVLSASRLGITQSSLLKSVLPLAKGFAEHVLADAKNDDVLTGEEEAYLRWIIQTFGFESSYESYLYKEIEILREKTNILSGNLDPIKAPQGVNLKSGEILYFCQTATVRYIKPRRTNDSVEEHSGRLLLTDGRVIFESATKSISFPYKSIIAWKASDDRIMTKLANKPEITFFIPPGSERFLNDKFKAIIELHSRTLRRRVEGQIDRYIPQDVRQRVWQRYGGKCVDCGATEYLEFDHIIPVARGGSNSDQNIQILCRKCNLAKSDNI